MKKIIEPTLEETIILVTQLHKGQVDLIGEPYINHVLRVMLRMYTDEGRKAALLHDVGEDCGVTAEQLRELGYRETIIEAFECVTKRAEEKNDYEAFIERICRGSLLARDVKIADLRDNMDPSRGTHDGKSYHRRMTKYQKALDRIAKSIQSEITPQNKFFRNF
jgi:(p)ppGpp synthase/HD superfamily hydrolase